MIEVLELSKHYGHFKAVDDLSFSVSTGEVLGFLGPNGAGKSTTMKMLTGFLAPTHGTARIFGHDIQQDSFKARQEIGYLPEGAPAYGEMRVESFLEFIAEARGFQGKSVHERAREAAIRLNLEPVLSQPIDTLSKGFKRRVGLAQAILHDPKVLILDEPTDGLDPNQKHEVRRLIREMAEGKIIIISTHILEEVGAVCNRAMIIARGKLLADDTPAELTRTSRFHNAITLKVPEPEMAATALSELSEVRKVERKENELTVFPAADADLFRAVSGLAERSGWAVESMRMEAGRLEDVFREITREEARS